MEHNTIEILDALVAQRIAAGEVIERPASIVRELVDNSIDAKADRISVELVEGGIDSLIVVDNGIGIPFKSLPLCAHSHATSKVKRLEDLESLHTMGFRGEALYSIAAGAELTIRSTREGEIGHHITFDNGVVGEVKPGGPDKGTVVEVKNLFAHIPARRTFLKTAATEARMAKVALIEKALSHPHITFQMYHKGSLTVDLPKTTSQLRVLDILSSHKDIVPSSLIEMVYSASSFSLYAVATKEEVYRHDKKYIKIFINKRVVDEYAITQAVTYGYDQFLPGGAFPYCYLFIQVDPSLVDFNIHPAKREVKLRNKAEIHSAVVMMIKQFLSKEHQNTTRMVAKGPLIQHEMYNNSPFHPSSFSQSDGVYHKRSTYGEKEPDWFNRAKSVLERKREEETHKEIPTESAILRSTNFRYLGQLFSLFLLVEQDSSLYLIDQHAAHERILYDELRSQKGSQPLMIPIEFEVERSIDTFLQQHSHWYDDFGIHIEPVADLVWALTSVVPHYKMVEKDVIASIQSYSGGNIDELHKLLYANTACKAAIKDGDIIDTDRAIALIQKVFDLTYPVCPHGRNFVVEITRDELFKSVGRIV